MFYRFSIQVFLLLLAFSACCQGNTWTDQDVNQLYQHPAFKTHVGEWLEFQSLSVGHLNFYSTDRLEAQKLNQELKLFREKLFEEHPNIIGGQVASRISAFIEQTPYANHLKQREIRRAEIFWTRIANNEAVQNLRKEFPVFTQDQIRNMISGEVSKRAHTLLSQK